MLQTGVHTEAESSQTVPPTSTTLCLWLVPVKTHGQSKIVGELHGEKMDILDLKKETLVMSATDHHIPLVLDSISSITPYSQHLEIIVSLFILKIYLKKLTLI